MQLQLITGLALSCVLCAPALAQTGVPVVGHAPKPGKTTELPATASSVGENEAVITLKDACKSGTAGCVSSVTRKQFEKVANAIKPDMTTEQRRTFGLQYARLLALAEQARAAGLENDPKVQEMLKFATDQILVEALNKRYSDEYSHPTDQQIDDYYKKNSKNYVNADLQRIIIPSEPAASEVKKPTPEEEKAYVEKVRQQWVGGADPATLQKEAVTRMGLSSSPEVTLNNQRPGMIPPEQDSVFNLKPGEISQPFVDTGAAYIYKMVSVKQVPLNDVKTQIAKAIHDQKMREKIQEISATINPVLNDAYFGPEKPPFAPMGPGHEQGAVEQPEHSGPPASAPSPK
jgi:parvulin-like peptidyl-prolyl isomerase